MNKLAYTTAAAVLAFGFGFAGTASAVPKLADVTTINFLDTSAVMLTTSFCNVMDGDTVTVELFDQTGGTSDATDIVAQYIRNSQASGNKGGKNALDVIFTPIDGTHLDITLVSWGSRKNGHVMVVLDEADEFGDQAWGVNLHKKDCEELVL